MPAPGETRFFTELSGELDRRLDHHAHLLGGLRPDWAGEAGFPDEMAAVLFEYLGRRIALEHVFFARSLRESRLEATRMRAEVWRWKKILAAERAESARRSGRPSPGRPRSARRSGSASKGVPRRGARG